MKSEKCRSSGCLRSPAARFNRFSLKNVRTKDLINRALCLSLLLLPALGCEDDGSEARPDAAISAPTWSCDAEHDGWSRCEGGAAQYCHIVEGMEPHFHVGADCQQLSLDCVQLEEGRAVCADPNSACQAGEFKCGAEGSAEENTAFNCVEGRWAIQPCGTAKVCHEEADEAHCEAISGLECGGFGHLHDGECHCETGYILDEHDPMICVPSQPFPELACAQFGDAHQHEATLADTHEGAFDEAHHGPQDEPIHITPLAEGLGYLHFPAFVSGEHALFLSRADALDGVTNKDGVEVTLSGGDPVSVCEAAIPQHYHLALTKPADVEKVPYVLRFKAGGAPLVVMIKRIPEEDDHEHDHD
ncbi:hypothetical protein KJ940_08045 [Myxococcota bacterium]|nr:hypothetical protein [Myxococcota bacterium]